MEAVDIDWKEEHHNYDRCIISDQWWKNVFKSLPNRVRIPKDIKEEEISEWLSDRYGFYLNGYDIVY